MKKYHWNLKEIISRIKYVRGRLKVSDNVQERKRLFSSLLVYYEMLGITYNNKKRVLKFDIENYLISKDKLFKNFDNAFDDFSYSYVDNDYIDFLLELVLTIYNDSDGNIMNEKDEIEFLNSDFSDDNIIFIINCFYKALDKELSNFANIILSNNKENIEFNDYKEEYNIDDYCLYGYNFMDSTYKDSFIICFLQHNFNDIITLAHEVMHGIHANYIDFYNIDTYYGFAEVTPIVIEMLLCDYLEKDSFDKNEIDKIRKDSLYSFIGDVSKVVKLITNNDRDNNGNYLVDFDEISGACHIDLLDIESYIVAYGLYKQITYNKEIGINNLKLFMKTKLSPNEIPNFDFIDLNNDKLLELASELGRKISKDKNVKIKRKTK